MTEIICPVRGDAFFFSVALFSTKLYSKKNHLSQYFVGIYQTVKKSDTFSLGEKKQVWRPVFSRKFNIKRLKTLKLNPQNMV
jgi:hypothetical protein